MGPIRKTYDPQKMAQVLEDVKKGVPVATAARTHGVPRTTLINKNQGKSSLICSPGPSTILDPEEENVLVKWILAMAKRHFPVSKTQLLDSVQKLMNESNKVKTFENNNRPSDKWYRLFLKRHPEISPRTCQILTPSRENVSEEQIRSWFEEVKDYLMSRNIFDITNDPKRVFNTDESAFYLSPKSDKVLVKKGQKSVYRAAGDEKENLTVLVTTNAAGNMAPPMIVYSYARIPGHIATSVPAEWGIGTSENGWMCAATLFEFICNIFNPWLEKQNIEKPIILFLDGHASHLTLHLSNFCAENGIELVALYPNSTHLLQPLDVAVFRPLKVAYKNEAQKWRIENLGNRMQKHHFPEVFKRAVNQINEDTVKHGFRGTGLCPFDVKNVHFEKISKKIVSLTTPTEKCETLKNKDVLKGLEEKIAPDKLEEFKKCLKNNLNWNKAIEDTSLFEIWRSLNNEDMPEAKSNEESDNQNTMTDINRELTDKENEFEGQNKDKKSNLHRKNELTPPIEERTKKTETEQGKKSNSNMLVTPGPSREQFNSNVPSPFKKALFWPEPKASTSKRKRKEKIPSVVTSEAWRTYHLRKENDKKRKLEEKEERMKQRKNKIQEKNNTLGKIKNILKHDKKHNEVSESSEEEEEWQESGSSLDDIDIFENEQTFCETVQSDNVSVGDYIQATFLGGKRNATIFRYVCVVQRLFKEEVEVMCMKSVKDKKSFIFNEKDISCINKKSILGILPTPEIHGTGERQKYEFFLPVDIYEA